MRPPKQRRQPSTIDKLPEEIRDQLARLRREGRTITEIHDHLAQLGAGVSRSAIGRHVKSMAEVGEDMRRAGEMARFVVDQFGEETDERVGRANMAILQSAIMELLTERPVDDETGEVARLDAGEMKALSLSLQRLISSQRIDADRQLKMKAEAKREAQEAAAKAVDRVAKTQAGLTADTVAAIKREILGITP